MTKVGSFLIAFLLVLCGCSDQNIAFGKWKSKSETHEFVILTKKDALTLGEMPPLPFPARNEKGWSRVKKVGEFPEDIKPTLKPYSIAVIESGFVFLQTTRPTGKSETYDDIEWGWRIILENRSKRGIHAYGGYSLMDSDGFILTATGNDWDNDESGVYVAAGKTGIIQGRGLWRVEVASKPYPPSRVDSGDYKLFLRHALFERLDDDINTKE
ncbi:MAG: hypothetical protein JRE47_14895 [Deltaproteobacteria bacterium]|nr:hypothetical protein [Deltaproteobacteria bacterium]